MEACLRSWGVMCERADFGKGSEVLSNVHVRVFKGSGISISLLFHNYFSVLCQPPFMHLMWAHEDTTWSKYNMLMDDPIQCELNTCGNPSCWQVMFSTKRLVFPFPPYMYFFFALWEIISFMDIYSRQEQDKNKRHTYFRFDISGDPSEYAEAAWEGKGWMREERDGSSRERSQCLTLRGRKEPPSWKSWKNRRVGLL